MLGVSQVSYSTRASGANKRRTHCFHGGDEVHGLLVDFLLQETEPLVVEDEADGWITKRSRRHFNLIFSSTYLWIYHKVSTDICFLKGRFTPKSKIHIFPLTCSAIYKSREFWCELPSFGDFGRRDFCLFSNIMGLNGALSL